MNKTIAILFAVLLLGCAPDRQKGNGYVQVDGTLLRDSLGRSLILRGLNYVNKDKKNKHLNLIGDTAFRDMKNWGYNSVRLGINWSALEPAPHQYNPVYLQDLDDRIAYAEQHGLYIILDMHQDLYGEKFGGGAPLWATLDDDLPHVRGGTWSDAYFISPAVQRAFDNFWANKPVDDGMGVQDHYVKTWRMLAERYRDNTIIIGFDLMNEPFIGSPVSQALNSMILSMTDFLNEKQDNTSYTPEQVAAMWIDSQGKEHILSELQDTAIFVKVLDQMEPVYKEFEERDLMSFYTKLAISIREVNPNHILFWEPSVSSNNGIPTYLSRVEEAGNQQAYMPHFYDVVLDTDLAGEADAGRLSIMFDRLEQSADKLQMPLIIGEWGAFYGGGKEVVGAAQKMTAGIDRMLIGDMYWDYFRGMERQAYFREALQRPYAACTVGQLLGQHLTDNAVKIVWQEDGSKDKETLIYLPTTQHIQITGLADEQYQLRPLTETAAWLAVEALGKEVERTVSIRWEKE